MRYALVFVALLTGCRSQDGSARSHTPNDTAPSEIARLLRSNYTDDEDLTIAARQELQHPTGVDPQVLIDVVNDVHRTLDARGLAFVLFWNEYVNPPVDLETIIDRYKIRNWFTPETVDDLGNAESTLIDDVRMRHPFDYSYYELTVDPGGHDTALNVWIAVTPPDVDLIDALQHPSTDKLKIVAVRVNHF